MAQWRILLGLLSVTGLSGAAFTVGCSGGSTGSTPLNIAGATAMGGAGGGAAGAATTAGAGGSTAGTSATGGSGGSGISCAATAAASTVVSPYAITADAATNTVYWSNSSDTDPCSNVIMMQAPGGMPTEIAKVDQSTASTGHANIGKGLALDGMGNLYYGSDYVLYKVKAMPGSTPTKVGTFEGKPTAIWPTATRIFTTLDLDGAIQYRSPDPAVSGCADPITRPKVVNGETDAQKMARISGGACAFSESIGGLVFDALALSGKLFVFIDGSNVAVADSTVDATKEAGHTQITSTDSFNQISGLTAVGSTAIFGEATGGIIEKITVPTEQPAMALTDSPTILLTDPTLLNPTSFVNDGKSVFFRTGATATDSCMIMQLPGVAGGGISPAVAGGGASGTSTAVQLAKVDACVKMNLAVGKNALWYTDRAHNQIKSVAIPQ